ncbi:MAG: energy-coupling factor ABC transporter permease, partial [Coriobacteriia bacterium]|nr:energy-coupling factor ABC transporter permease [Coriobacteriia bacterium]
GVQALFFADGGLLALGANIINLGFLPAFIAYPLIYKRIVGSNPSRARIFTGSMAGAVVGLQLGAFGVVLETALSGVSELPFATFMLVMLPIHLAIGIAEGLVTAGVIIFVRNAQPEILERAETRSSLRGVAMKPVLVGLLVAAVLSGAAFSWFASTNADGLEWSIARIAGEPEIEGRSDNSLHETLAIAQEKIAFLPEYGLPTGEAATAEGEGEAEAAASWPAIDPGTSLAGLVGAAITFVLAGAIGVLLRRRAARRNDSSATI